MYSLQEELQMEPFDSNVTISLVDQVYENLFVCFENALKRLHILLTWKRFPPEFFWHDGAPRVNNFELITLDFLTTPRWNKAARERWDS